MARIRLDADDYAHLLAWCEREVQDPSGVAALLRDWLECQPAEDAAYLIDQGWPRVREAVEAQFGGRLP